MIGTDASVMDVVDDARLAEQSRDLPAAVA